MDSPLLASTGPTGDTVYFCSPSCAHQWSLTATSSPRTMTASTDGAPAGATTIELPSCQHCVQCGVLVTLSMGCLLHDSLCPRWRPETEPVRAALAIVSTTAEYADDAWDAALSAVEASREWGWDATVDELVDVVSRALGP